MFRLRSSVKARTFLATTTLDEFWDTSKPILFLGKWCCQSPKKEQLECIDAKVMPSPYLENNNYCLHYEFTRSCYEKLLPKIAYKLNIFHGQQYSLRYWRLLIGPFLFWYANIIYDRYLHLKAAYQINQNLETYGLSRDCYLVPLSTQEFTSGIAYDNSVDDIMNLQIFTQLLDLEFKKPIQYKKISREHELNLRKKSCIKMKYSFRTSLIISLLEFFYRFFKIRTIGILLGDFNFKDLLKMFFLSKFRIFPIIPKRSINRGQVLCSDFLLHCNIDLENRYEIFNIPPDDFLSRIILKTLPINMPMVFIEGYCEELKLSREYFPFCCSTILEAQCGSYDQHKLWLGEQMEKGAKLVGMQHGGNYGMQKIHFSGFLEADVSDFFITWGWKYSDNFVPAPVPELTNLSLKFYREKHNSQLSGIIWLPTFGEIKYIPGNPAAWLTRCDEYLLYQKKFYNSLNNNIKQELVMRLHPACNYFDSIKEFFPDLKYYFPKCRGSFLEDITSKKIIVIDNVCTPMLYALAFNIPTILFWDKEVWFLREEAMLHILALKEVGIYHDTPESAAIMLNDVAKNPGHWWYSKNVQSIRRQFCNSFARTSGSYLQEWRNILLNISDHER